jgi:hypothetical protein
MYDYDAKLRVNFVKRNKYSLKNVKSWIFRVILKAHLLLNYLYIKILRFVKVVESIN